MEFHKILVPVTGTEADDEAIRLACRLAKRDKGKIWTVYVVTVKRTLPLEAEVEPEIKKAEEIINHFWFKESSNIPPPNCKDWLFENYPEYLLKTIRLGYWDGARLPHYIGEIFDLYSENKDFKGIRDTLSLLVTRVTRHVGKSTAYN